MPGTREPINGGLVTSRDATLLQPGELSDARNVYAVPGSPGLRRSKGRAQFAGGLSNIGGIGYANFDSTADQVVIVDNGTYKTAAAAESGVFASCGTGAGTTLDVVNHENHAILLSGGNVNRVMMADATTRPHGLVAITDTPGVTVTSSGGTWPLGATSVPNYFEYWTTEVWRNGTDSTAAGYEEVESTFTGVPYSAFIPNANSYATITRPAVKNNDATHWRVYRSNAKSSKYGQAYPLGFFIAEIPIGTLTFNDGKTTLQALTFATTAVNMTSWPLTVPPNVELFAQGWTGLTNPFADDGLTMNSGTVSTTWVEHAGGSQVISLVKLGNFGFTGIGSPITNIQIKVDGTTTGQGALTAYLTPDGGVTWSKGISIPLSTTPVTIDGGQWGRTWNGAEFANGSFEVMLAATASLKGTGTVNVDYVQIAIDHGGSTAQQIVQFPATELIIGTQRVLIGANGPPPRATTGAVIQGALLMNDIENPTEVAWTIPGTIDYCPVLYRNNMGSPVACIRALGTLGLVGGERLQRFNFIPIAEDPEFNTGRATDIVDSEEGIVSNKGAVTFVLNGRPMLFYVSQHFLKMTNAYEATTATDDVIWSEMVNPEQTNRIFVENNVENQELLVFYPSVSSTAVDSLIRLSYDITQLKNGKLRVISISSVSLVGATSGVLPSGRRNVYTCSNGAVYVENRGLEGAPSITTREIQQAGPGNSWELLKLGVHHQGGGGMLRTSAVSNIANEGDSSTPPSEIQMNHRCESILDTAISGEGIRITLEGDDDELPWEIDYGVLYPAEQGENIAFNT